MAQLMQINKCNTAHKDNRGQKSHDHLNWCRKSLWHNSTAFYDKTLKKLGTEWMYLNRISTNLCSTWYQTGQTETISSKVRNETRVSILLTPIQYSTGIPSQSNKARERNKRIQIGKEEAKLSLIANDMILFWKDPKESTKKKPPRSNKFPAMLQDIKSSVKVSSFSIYLYCNSEQAQNEIRKTISFTK
jgi:hypothetical protein